jgi:hypothetical protein
MKNFVLHGLLAQQALQLRHLCFQRAVVGCRHNLLACGGGGERALAHQAAPREQLIGANAMLPGHE